VLVVTLRVKRSFGLGVPVEAHFMNAVRGLCAIVVACVGMSIVRWTIIEGYMRYGGFPWPCLYYKKWGDPSRKDNLGRRAPTSWNRRKVA